MVLLVAESRTGSAMKTTIDIPDELYRRVKAAAALKGRRIRDVTIELYERWLRQEGSAQPAQEGSRQEWLDAWIRMGEELCREAPPGPTATEVLAADRARLERG